MDLEYIEYLYSKYKNGIVCNTHKERVQVIEYFLYCGIGHGSSGYSKRVYDNCAGTVETTLPNIGIYFNGKKYVISGCYSSNCQSFDTFLYDAGVMSIPDLEEFV